jgi:hypothetical protein
MNCNASARIGSGKVAEKSSVCRCLGKALRSRRSRHKSHGFVDFEVYNPLQIAPSVARD